MALVAAGIERFATNVRLHWQRSEGRSEARGESSRSGRRAQARCPHKREPDPRGEPLRRLARASRARCTIPALENTSRCFEARPSPCTRPARRRSDGTEAATAAAAPSCSIARCCSVVERARLQRPRCRQPSHRGAVLGGGCARVEKRAAAQQRHTSGCSATRCARWEQRGQLPREPRRHGGEKGKAGKTRAIERLFRSRPRAPSRRRRSWSERSAG